MTSPTGKQISTIHVLPNVSRNKGNQTMSFGHLIEYNMKKYFSRKTIHKNGGKTSPTPFSKKQKYSMSLEEQFGISSCLFFVCPTRGLPKYFESKVLSAYFYLVQIFFKNQKEVLDQSPCLIFCIIFEEKYFSSYT